MGTVPKQGRYVSFLVVGNINHDTTYNLPSSYEHQYVGKMRAVSREDTVGGSGANTARWLAATGAEVWMCGRVGRDTEGGQCIGALEKDGVHTDFVTVDAVNPTASAVIMLAGSSKQIVSFQPRALEVSLAVDDIVATGVTAAHFSVADSPGLGVLAKSLAAAHIPVSVELAGSTMESVRTYADVVLCNAEELSSLFDIDVDLFSPADVCTLGNPATTWVVTNKGKNVVAVNKNTRTVVKVAPVKIVQRLGGGDAFNAGMLHSWRSGHTIVKAVQSGLLCAVEALKKTGAGPA